MLLLLAEKILMTLSMVAIWRGAWMLMDYYFGRNIYTMWISLILGVVTLNYINQNNK